MREPHTAVAYVANGLVRVGDWVRELPATHFQPCSCCLCRPPAGARPIYRIGGIEVHGGRSYLRFVTEHRHLADEFERVEPPGEGTTPAIIGRDPALCDALLRDWETLICALTERSRARPVH